MDLHVHKIVKHVEETRWEHGVDVSPPHVAGWVAVVLQNPYPLDSYVEDPASLANEVALTLGDILIPPLVELLEGQVECYGKAVLVGLDGELEHGSALIHCRRFGDVFRAAVDGTEGLPAAEKIGLPGASLDVPLKHKLNLRSRPHHQTLTLSVPNAPRPQEIVVACVAANMGRALARPQ